MPIKLTLQGEPEHFDDILAGIAPNSPLGQIRQPQPAQPAPLPLNLRSPLGSIPQAQATMTPAAAPVEQPGRLQRAEHVLGTIGQVAGSALVPNLMPWIPGTRQHDILEQNLSERSAQRQAETGLTQAEGERDTAQAQNLRSEAAERDYKREHPEQNYPPSYAPGSYIPDPTAEGGFRQLGQPKGTAHFEPKTVTGADGKPMNANYDPSTGRYYDLAGNLIPDARPYEKPPGVGTLPPEIAGILGPMPNPADYPGGEKDPKYTADRTAWGKAAQKIKEQEVQVRGQSYGQFRPVQIINPQTGNLEWAFAGTAIGQGAAPAQGGMQAQAKQAQFSEMHTAAQRARNAINSLDRPFSPAQIAKLTLAMSQNDPTVFRTEIETMLGTQQLTPAQEDFVVWISQLNERALSLRNVAGMGQGAEDMRKAIRATLPSVRSGSKQLALKQLDAFENQVKLLERGIPGVKGSAAGAAAPAGGNGGPAPGTVEDGYRFKGGDPADKNNWEKAQ